MKRNIKPQTFLFEDDGFVPNNPRLPFVLYRGVLDFIGITDPEVSIEGMFRANHWGESWRNGIYNYAHYHSSIHEVMGIARGRATVRFGGGKGREIEVTQGDVVVLPAGTGHQSIATSPDLVVIGAYPKSGRYDLCRASKGDHDRAVEAIPNVPLPDTDPIFGASGPLLSLWQS
jgi:uncharacterized protein YjlB